MEAGGGGGGGKAMRRMEGFKGLIDGTCLIFTHFLSHLSLFCFTTFPISPLTPSPSPYLLSSWPGHLANWRAW